MNSANEFNRFRQEFESLLADIESELGAEKVNPYAGAGDGEVLEHTTRVRFFDRFVTALGWDLGQGGDMAEEARIAAETTTYMDYVGVSQHRRPVVIWEVKRWEKPFISRAKGRRKQGSAEDLLLEALRHLNDNGSKETSPVTQEWHEHIAQVAGYVRDLNTQHGHCVMRTVLASGRWMVIFKAPVKTFVERQPSSDDILILQKEEYVDSERDLYKLLSTEHLALRVPFPLFPEMLPSYVSQDNLKAVFRGVHVRHESSGSSFFERSPQILVYSALVFERKDGMLLKTLLDASYSPLRFDALSEDEESGIVGGDTLNEHLAEVRQSSERLLHECSQVLGFDLVPAPLADFCGFSESRDLRATPRDGAEFMTAVGSSNEWLLVTGRDVHFIRAAPAKDPCPFHEWKASNNVGRALLDRAITVPRTANPRSFFVDAHSHHCSHRVLDQARQDRCHIRPIDERICCPACTYAEQCWTPRDFDYLPCGGGLDRAV